MIEIAILILLVFMVGYAVYDLVEGRGQTKALANSVEEKSAGLLATVSERIQQWQNGRGSSPQTDMVAAFDSWVKENLSHRPEIQQWLTSLSGEAKQILVDRIAEFANDLNIELIWLLEHRLESYPDLKQVLTEVIIDYCSACWRAIKIQENVQLIKMLDTLERDPANKQYRHLGEKIYTELVNRAILPAPKPELVMAPENERWQHIAESLQQAATTNRAEFEAVMKEAMAAK